MNWWNTLFCLIFYVNCAITNDLPPPCFSEIYCYGQIIKTVMQMRIFNDSKTFVDLKLKNSPNETLKSFETFMQKYNNSQPTKDDVENWLGDNFDAAGSELIPWKPVDFRQNPEILNQIRDRSLRNFASDLNNIWIELCRKMKDEVKVIFAN